MRWQVPDAIRFLVPLSLPDLRSTFFMKGDSYTSKHGLTRVFISFGTFYKADLTKSWESWSFVFYTCLDQEHNYNGHINIG